MKRFFFFSFLFLTSSFSFSETSWELIRKNDISDIYIDSISKSNPINVWVKEKHKKEMIKEDSNHNKYKYDTTKRKYRR